MGNGEHINMVICPLTISTAHPSGHTTGRVGYCPKIYIYIYKEIAVCNLGGDISVS